MSMLFEKTNIKTLELKNRLVRSATHEGMSDENGFPTPDKRGNRPLSLPPVLHPGRSILLPLRAGEP
jgi:hypothetical protein